MSENQSKDDPTDNDVEDKASNKKPTIKLFSTTKLHLMEKDELIPYIVCLHKRIRMFVKRCRMYKEKVAKLVSRGRIGDL